MKLSVRAGPGPHGCECCSLWATEERGSEDRYSRSRSRLQEPWTGRLRPSTGPKKRREPGVTVTARPRLAEARTNPLLSLT